MNIFFLDKDHKIAAQMQCDKHVVKMILETAQMLSTAARAQGHDIGYKTAYPNHPMTLWVNESPHNYAWAIIHAFELCKEYTKRYNKIHKTKKVIHDLYEICNGDYAKMTEPPKCMPDEYKCDDYVQSYRNYYVGDKKRFARYTNRGTPEFMQ